MSYRPGQYILLNDRGYQAPPRPYSDADAIDHACFRDWAANRPRFRYLLALTRAPDAPEHPCTPEHLAATVGELTGWEIFASGPPGFVTGCAAAVRALGTEPAAIHAEEFFTDPQPWVGQPSTMAAAGTRR